MRCLVPLGKRRHRIPPLLPMMALLELFKLLHGFVLTLTLVLLPLCLAVNGDIIFLTNDQQ